jgi:cysteine synthase
MIFRDLTQAVGHTPLVELARIGAGLSARVVGKLEMRNPLGSVKDRVAVALIDNAERRGVLRPGMTIVEATGGNAGIGLAFVAAIRGYRLILTMPSTMSRERVALLRQLGAGVVLTPGILMIDAVARAEQLVRETPGAITLDQFRNPANPEIHRRTTAVEIWDDFKTRDSCIRRYSCSSRLRTVAGVIRSADRSLVHNRQRPDVLAIRYWLRYASETSVTCEESLLPIAKGYQDLAALSN